MSAKGATTTRVLVYADSAIHSGAESVLVEVVAGLAARDGFEISVAAPPENEKLTRELISAAGTGTAIEVPSQASRLAAFDLYDPRRVRSVRRALEPALETTDVLLLNLPSAELGATPLLALPDPGVPVVGLMHVSGTMGDLGFTLGRIRERLARRAVSRLDSVCVLSNQAARDYPSQWPAEGTEINVLRLPKPATTAVDPGPARDKLGLPAGRQVIGMAGRLTVKQKGQDTLVDAAAELLADRPDLVFALAGEGKDRRAIESRIARHGIGESFHVLGQVGDIGGFLSAVDLIAIPSRFEGLPLIALEALAAGTPGIASSVDGLVDVWPAEWRVEPGDPGALANAIGSLLDTGAAARQHLVSSGRARMDDLTTEDPAEDMAECLKQIVSFD